MSRPRKPYGPKPPGRLLATMIKVLAAEMSDAGRLTRGKRYWSDDAVIDITIGHGAVTAEVQGSRAQPYVVTLEAAGGSGMPGRRDLWVQCTCPDDSGTGAEACKHAVAAMFALSDEVAIEPELVDRWRGGRRLVRPGGDAADRSDDRSDDRADDDAGGEIAAAAGRTGPDDVARDAVATAWADEIAHLPTRRDRAGVDGDGADDADDDAGAAGGRVIELDPSRRRRAPELDAIAQLLSSPTGSLPVALPDPTMIDQRGIRDPLLAEVLDDVLDHLQIRWE